LRRWREWVKSKLSGSPRRQRDSQGLDPRSYSEAGAVRMKAWREVELEQVPAMYAAGVAAVQEEFDERGLGPAGPLVQVIVDAALAAVAGGDESSAEGCIGGPHPRDTDSMCAHCRCVGLIPVPTADGGYYVWQAAGERGSGATYDQAFQDGCRYLASLGDIKGAEGSR
jgi:hypothetical protein